jgi:hypothetical protein
MTPFLGLPVPASLGMLPALTDLNGDGTFIGNCQALARALVLPPLLAPGTTGYS